MLAHEARKTASEKIWNSLPSILRYNIEDAVNEGKLHCEIIFNDDKMDKANFDDCIGYFNNLNNGLLNKYKKLLKIGKSL